MNVSMVTPDVLSVAATLLKIATDPKAAQQLLEEIQTAASDVHATLAKVQLEQRNAASTLATVVDRSAALDAREAALAVAETKSTEVQAAINAGRSELAQARDAFDREKRQFVDAQAAKADELAAKEATLAAVQASVDEREAAVAAREAAVADREAKFRAALEV